MIQIIRDGKPYRVVSDLNELEGRNLSYVQWYPFNGKIGFCIYANSKSDKKLIEKFYDSVHASDTRHNSIVYCDEFDYREIKDLDKYLLNSIS